jgi:hypothetical protein
MVVNPALAGLYQLSYLGIDNLVCFELNQDAINTIREEFCQRIICSLYPEP